MSAEVLGRAASLMRERASAATDGPWSPAWLPEDPGVCDGPVVVGGVVEVVTEWHVNKPDAEHIASWHPAVALAVADWLEEEADSHHAHAWDARRIEAALAVARAYLGEDA